MSLTQRNLWIGIGAVAAIQAAVLIWMIWDRAQLLASGREIVLEVVPVDPRSLFRGDYVILNYDITRVPTPEGAKRPKRGSQLYVTLEKGKDGHWQAAGSSPTPPTNVRPDQVVLKGRVAYASRPTSTSPALATVKYGIESYFVPEGAGRELEKLVGERKLDALVAVDDEGNAGIKGLIVDGRQVYEEPLF